MSRILPKKSLPLFSFRDTSIATSRVFEWVEGYHDEGRVSRMPSDVMRERTEGKGVLPRTPETFQFLWSVRGRSLERSEDKRRCIFVGKDSGLWLREEVGCAMCV